MPRSLSLPLFLFLLLSPLLVAGGAVHAADRVAEVEITQNYIVPPKIRVQANQIGYTQATTGRLDWDFGLSGHCRDGNHLKSSHMWIAPESNPNDFWGTAWDFKWLSENMIFERFSNRGANLSSAQKAEALQACKDFLAQQMASGKSKAWVLSREHTIPGPLFYVATHSVECAPNGCSNCAQLHDSESKRVDLLNPVICEKSPIVIPGSFKAPPTPPIPPGPQDLKQTFGVTAATLSISPKQASVVTQAKLTVSGEITANGPGRVKYRVVHNGGKGPMNTLNFSKAKTASFSFPLTVKCPKENEGASNKTMKTGGGSGGGIGGLKGAPSNVKNGTVLLEIAAPSAGKKKSNLVAYSITCKKTGTLATPLPDLKIASADYTPAPSFTSPASVSLVVRNGGAKGAGQSVARVTGKVNGVQKSWTQNVPALAAGAKTEVKILLNARGEIATPVTVKVDANSQIKESNEKNNTDSAQ